MVKLDLKNKYWCALLISVAASMGVLILNSNRFVSASVNSEYPSKMQSTIINSHSDEKPSSSIAYVVTKTILEKDFLNVHTTYIKSNPKIDVIIAPSGMNETEASQWLENAKSVALKDYLKTGRVQKVKMANETNIMTIIGSSSIPSVSAVDVSRYQNWMTQSDYTKLSKIGVKAAVIKISEGRSVENKFAAQQIEMAKSAGMRVSVYHFAHFTNSAEAEQEAVWTEKNISNLGLPKSTLIIADMEASESIYAANVGSNLNQFWKQLKSYGYNNHGVYTSHGYSTRDAMVKTVGSERSWIAQYPKSPSNTKLLNSEFGAWQFSSTAAIPGDTNVKHVLDVSHDYSGMLTGCLFNSGERTLKYVTITNSTASIYSDFNFKVKARSADYFHRTLKVKRIYYRSNGGTYYSLYDNNNSWIGYINATFTQLANGTQGAAVHSNSYVVLKNNNADLRRGFSADSQTVPASTYYHKTLLAKISYYGFDGSVFYSVYDYDNHWLGYLNAEDVKITTGPQGDAYNIYGNKYVTVSSHVGTIWGNFRHLAKAKVESCYQKTFLVKRFYNHYNGAVYYSLYDGFGNWRGYINADLTKNASGPQGAYIKSDFYVTVDKNVGTVWKNFKHTKFSSLRTHYLKTYQVKTTYNHLN